MTARAHVWISGRVQGVWFRASTQQQAVALGLAGWVRNLADGRVEAVFEGPDESVAAMVRWCFEGSPQSRVEQVERVAEQPEGLDGFEVR